MNSALEEKNAPRERGAAVRFWRLAADLHDRVFSESKKQRLKSAVITLSIVGFAGHLLMIFLANTLPTPPALIAGMGRNYLSAISTPFNFILFYEVMTLIAVLHESTTKSIANQYQIVSLIYIRDVFKDIAEAGELVTQHKVTWEALPLFVDMWSGFAMFLLVAVFQHAARHSIRHDSSVNPTPALKRYIAQKKLVALCLGLLLVLMAVYNLGLLGVDAAQMVAFGHTTAPHPTTYYNDLFTVMIFTDVLVLILSIIVSGRYDSVFRSAAFVVSIVMIRFSLTEGYPFGAPLAIVAMVFGILTLLVFNYHVRVQEASARQRAEIANQ